MNQDKCVSDILAYCFMKGRIILVAAIVFGIFFAGIKGYQQYTAYIAPANSEEKIEASYQKKLNAYEEDKANLQQSIDLKLAQIERIETYLQDSLLMQLDPYSFYKSTIEFGINLTDSDFTEDIFDYQTTPVDFATDKIGYQYVYAYQTEDLAALLNVDVKEAYLREVVAVSRRSGGLLEVRVYSDDPEMAEQWIEQIKTFLFENHDAVENNTYKHELTVLAESTKLILDDDMADDYDAKCTKITSLKTEIDKLEKSIKELEKPEKAERITKTAVITSTLLFGVIGLVAGLVLTVIILIVSMYMRQIIVSSFEVENLFNVPYLGLVKNKKGLLKKWANKVNGERVWTKQNDAAAYIAKAIRVKAASDKDNISVLVVSSLNICEDSKAMELLKNAWNSDGIKVDIATDALRNVLLLDKLEHYDGIVLLESPGVSSLPMVGSVLGKLGDERDKLMGFAMIQDPAIAKV
ncbi:MAG: hypothetical protein HUJ69_00120 [Lachnospiraceae bacterium]|nr:hypothetical protein [Lachnospiraceae bacterium]